MPRTPNLERRAIRRECVEMGLEAPLVIPVVKQNDEAFAEMERRLGETEWLAAPDFGLADIRMIP